MLRVGEPVSIIDDWEDRKTEDHDGYILYPKVTITFLLRSHQRIISRYCLQVCYLT